MTSTAALSDTLASAATSIQELTRLLRRVAAMATAAHDARARREP